MAAITLALAGAWANAQAVRDYVFEDAYITYRFAETLAAGGGFAFNAGEPIFGTTTPLWTLLLAACAFLGLDVARCSDVLFAVFLSLAGLAGYVRLRWEGAAGAGFAFALAMVWGSGFVLPLAGMETPFLLALLLASSLAARSERLLLCGLLLGLALTVRYDAVVFAAALLAIEWWRGQAPWRAIGAGTLVFAPWLVFAQLSLGSVFPHTLGAKAGDAATWHYLGASLLQRARLATSPFVRLRSEFEPLPELVTALLVLALAATACFALPAMMRSRSGLLCFPVYAILLWLGYGVIAPPIEHNWYLAPASALLLLFAFAATGETIRRALRGRPATPRNASTAFALLLTFVSLISLPRLARLEIARLIEGPYYQERVLAYREFAQWLSGRELTDLRVLLHEPGYFGYLTGCRVIDAAGLVTRGVRFHGPRQQRDDFSDLVHRFTPDAIVADRPGARFDGYARVAASGARSLHVRRSILEARRVIEWRSLNREETSMSEIPRLSGDELTRTIEAADTLVLDVRRPAEIAEHGTTPGALTIPIDELADRLDEIPKDRPILTA